MTHSAFGRGGSIDLTAAIASNPSEASDSSYPSNPSSFPTFTTSSGSFVSSSEPSFIASASYPPPLTTDAISMSRRPLDLYRDCVRHIQRAHVPDLFPRLEE
jgi:hypothetical protein